MDVGRDRERGTGMARKKQLSYNDMSRAIEEMRERQVKERDRMASMMAVGLLNSNAAARLGDCSDADLRRIVAYMAEDIDRYMDRLEADKKAQNEARKAKKEQQDQQPLEAMLRAQIDDWKAQP